MAKSKRILWKILGSISIIIGMGITVIVFSSRYTLFCLYGLLGWIMGNNRELFTFDLSAVYFFALYIFAPIGFITLGIGMIRQRKWAVVLFVILIILWGSAFLWLLYCGYSPW